MPEEPGGQAADAARLGEWLARLEVARRLCRFYDPDHRATSRAREQLRRATRNLSGGEVVLSLSASGFALAGRPLGPLSKASARLAAQLWRLGIKAVRVHPPVADDSLERLLRLVMGLTDNPSEEDRSVVLAEERRISGVDLLPVAVAGLVYAEEEPAAGAAPVGRGPGGGARTTVAGASSPEASETPGDAIDELLALLDQPEDAGGGGAVLLRAVERVFGGGPGGGAGGGGGGAGGAGRSALDDVEDLFDVEDGTEAQAAHPAAAREGGFTIESGPAAGRGAEAARSTPRPSAAPGDSSFGAERFVSVPAYREREAPRSGRVPAYHRHPLLQGMVGAPTTKTLAEQLGDQSVRRHSEAILMTADRIWPDSEVAARAADRLVGRYFEQLELGEFDLARSIVRHLVEAGDPEPLERVSGQEGLEALLVALDTWGKEHRRKVAAIAGELGDRLVPTVGRGLESEEQMSRRRRMLEMMLAIGAPAVPHVMGWLQDERWFLVRNALFLLRRMKAPELAELAAPLADHDEPKVAAEAVRCLVEGGDPQWLARYRELLGREAQGAWREALALASTLRGPDVGRVLLAELQRRKGLHLREAETLDLIATLGWFALPEVADELERLASLANWKFPFRLTPVWEAVARAAARQPSPAAERILGRLAGHRDPVAALASDLLARRREGVQ